METKQVHLSLRSIICGEEIFILVPPWFPWLLYFLGHKYIMAGKYFQHYWPFVRDDLEKCAWCFLCCFLLAWAIGWWFETPRRSCSFTGNYRVYFRKYWRVFHLKHVPLKYSFDLDIEENLKIQFRGTSSLSNSDKFHCFYAMDCVLWLPDFGISNETIFWMLISHAVVC